MLKLSFSIRHWAGISWDEFCSTASGTGMSGIEIHDVTDPIFQGKGSPTNPDQAAYQRRHLASVGLTIPCLGTVKDFTDAGFLRELSECIDIAVNLGIETICIHTACTDMWRASEKY